MLSVIVAAVLALDAAPATPSPPPEIIRVRSNPFCTALRENIFHALQGLRINDSVLTAGDILLARLAHDAQIDPYGPSGQMDRYRLGQVVWNAAHNLTRVYDLLNDPARFPAGAQGETAHDLAMIKAHLEAVADAQEQTLNVLSGTYETDELNDLAGRGDGMEGALGQAEVADRTITLSDSILGATSRPPKTPASVLASSNESDGGVSVRGMSDAAASTRVATGQEENRVAAALLPAVSRCNTAQ